MSEYLIQGDTLTAIANVVRKKAGITDVLTPSDMIAAINNLNTDTEKTIFFYDYDGTELFNYSTKEAKALTSLPSPPKHDGLIFKGWTSDLTEISSVNRMSVGAMYMSSDTKLYVDITENATIIALLMHDATNVVVDWGDSSSPETYSGSDTWRNIAPSHTYSSTGNYIITISGGFTPGKSSSIGYVLFNQGAC